MHEIDQRNQHFRNTAFFPKIKSEYIVDEFVLCYIVLENR